MAHTHCKGCCGLAGRPTKARSTTLHPVRQSMQERRPRGQAGTWGVLVRGLGLARAWNGMPLPDSYGGSALIPVQRAM